MKPVKAWAVVRPNGTIEAAYCQPRPVLSKDAHAAGWTTKRVEIREVMKKRRLT